MNIFSIEYCSIQKYRVYNCLPVYLELGLAEKIKYKFLLFLDVCVSMYMFMCVQSVWRIEAMSVVFCAFYLVFWFVVSH